MPLTLPPKMLINYEDATIKYVHDELTSVIAGHPLAIETYTFYEEIDQWLGPWGVNGYPIGYGKFYAIAFNSNAKLQADTEARNWVQETTRHLQFALRDYVVGRMKQKTLRTITEQELRAAAFESHAKAYTDGGLTRVVLLAPEMIPVIAIIPAKEFNPLSPSFRSTVSQVFETIGMVAERTPGYVLPAMMPAHSGMFRIAMQRDAERFRQERQIHGSLGKLLELINSGQLDDLATLRKITEYLSRTDFGNQETAAAARMIINSAKQRENSLQQYYKNLTKQSPEIKAQLEGILKQF